MYEQVEKPKENKSRAVANAVTQKKSNGKQGIGFVDNRHEQSAQRQTIKEINSIANYTDPCIQMFNPTEEQEKQIAVDKTDETNVGLGWDEAKLDELVKWSRDFDQYKSYIKLIHFELWTVIKTDFSTGSDLPGNPVDDFVVYQKKYIDREELTGGPWFKGSEGTVWRTAGTSASEYSGCYLAEDVEQAEGYLVGEDTAQTEATVWKVTLKKPIVNVHVGGGLLDSVRIDQTFKATVTKKALEIDDAEILMKAMSEKSFSLSNIEGESGKKEIIVPWEIMDEYLLATPEQVYDIKNYTHTKKMT